MLVARTPASAWRRLDRLIIERGKPKMVVSDNGRELTSKAILAWTDQSRVGWHYIALGKTDADAESFIYRGPVWRKRFRQRFGDRSGASMYTARIAAGIMAAGPDGDRGSLFGLA